MESTTRKCFNKAVSVGPEVWHRTNHHVKPDMVVCAPESAAEGLYIKGGDLQTGKGREQTP